MFANKKIVLGICGGIAAYKAADIASWLKKNGADVHCVMTANAAKFISPLVLQALTANPVAVDEFVTGPGWGIVHIALADKADALVIVPATANVIGKIAAGIADDALTSAVLAATCPLFMAPAMNTNMYRNPAVQHNLATLREHGWHILPPASGHLACGAVGEGKLPDVTVIEEALQKLLLPRQDLAGKKVLVTAGPTSEPIDPVRYITNRSSGKMGYAVAAVARERGAEVVLVSGAHLATPAGVRLIKSGSAVEMREAVISEYDTCDIVVMAAAVADYRVAAPADRKIKKTDDNDELTLHLVKNPDILRELGEKKTHQLLVGFAAETNDLDAYATAKLQKKNADMLVGNDVSRAGAGFDVDTNIITIFQPGGIKTEYPLCSKQQAAEYILDAVVEALRGR
ncbi:MAG: bifunctional phosphopantothenoylcysteine decarboxylase/phosphopantothenate--cysteine ligase CoaBC [Firmicutes bacterium]|nr:bifunctional phosphopantothenoylcysteine decarboxylase/phosphopantothenate--cysteine ligase CoaBC [Bacillota bacterium]